MQKGYGRYADAYKQTAVTTSDPGKLIVMLYDGAIRFLTLATDRLDKRDAFGANQNMIKGKSIIAELMASLNLEKGGEIASNLQRLYAYMFNQLVDANVGKDGGRVHHVIDLLKELRTGWQSIPAASKADPKAEGKPAIPGTLKKVNVQG
jgi:flagellar protein FliS